MPLNKRFMEIKRDFQKRYGKKKGISIFYAWAAKQGYTEAEMTRTLLAEQDELLKSLPWIGKDSNLHVQ